MFLCALCQCFCLFFFSTESSCHLLTDISVSLLYGLFLAETTADMLLRDQMMLSLRYD